MTFIRLWCDERQIEKVKKLSSCSHVKPSEVTVAGGKKVKTYLVRGGPGLQKDIDTALG